MHCPKTSPRNWALNNVFPKPEQKKKNALVVITYHQIPAFPYSSGIQRVTTNYKSDDRISVVTLFCSFPNQPSVLQTLAIHRQKIDYTLFSLFLPHFTSVISGTKYNNTLYIMPQSFIHNVAIPVSFLRFAIGNRRARSWQPYGPQPETGQPAIEKRSLHRSERYFTSYTSGKRRYETRKQQVFPTFLTLLFYIFHDLRHCQPVVPQ